MIWYPTHSHYLDTVIVTVSELTRIGSNKYKLCKTLIWLDWEPNSWSFVQEARALPIRLPHPITVAENVQVYVSTAGIIDDTVYPPLFLIILLKQYALGLLLPFSYRFFLVLFWCILSIRSDIHSYREMILGVNKCMYWHSIGEMGGKVKKKQKKTHTHKHGGGHRKLSIQLLKLIYLKYSIYSTIQK